MKSNENGDWGLGIGPNPQPPFEFNYFKKNSLFKKTIIKSYFEIVLIIIQNIIILR